MKKNPAVIFLALLSVGSVLYEGVTTIMDAIGRNWGPQQNDLIARSVSAGIWLVSMAISMVILGFAFQLMGLKFGNSEREHKVVDGEVVQPKMLPDNGAYEAMPTFDGNVTYVGMDQYEDTNG